MALGEAIDNSQLSRFEKGKAVPSFEKLRALARIFNVSVQNFSDILDLEEFQAYKPMSEDYDDLLRSGEDLYARGQHGRAFVTFERAFEISGSTADEGGSAERIVEARRRMATALRKLGKLFMTEHELREILKDRERINRSSRMRTLLQLSYVYRERGDLYLASVLARECLGLAREEADLETQASVVNTLGNIHYDQEEYAEALDYYRRALEILDALGGHAEMRALVMVNLGGSLVAANHFEEGVALIQQAHARARERGSRRLAALSMTRLAEAHLQHDDGARSTQCLSESDALASGPEEAYHDILFLNAFRRWEMARQDGNGTREKITFGRLRHLRSLLERKFPEVDKFDRYIESTRRKHEDAS